MLRTLFSTTHLYDKNTKIEKILPGISCGTVGTMVASDPIGLRFKSSHQLILSSACLLQTVESPLGITKINSNQS